jgi:NAD(P)-dependent dehydrogenase (short-subunit alcohol dehydrogenase family)
MSVYDLTGRKALVTGGARGLGAGMAEALARAGAAVVIGDIREELGEATVDAIKKTGGDAAFLPLNVTDDHSWERCVEGTIAELGGLDILVNNAGVDHPAGRGPDRTISARCSSQHPGTALGIARLPRRVRRPGWSRRRRGQHRAGRRHDRVPRHLRLPAKVRIDRLTRVAAMESGKLGYAVRVNSIYPGLCPTEMGNQLAQDVVALGLFPSVPDAIGAVVGLTPQGRLGEVADMADAVVFLASDASRFITGAGLPVDGGMGM